ncbi:MAG: gas vesicle protein GvpJ [Haloglomus sp.]
MAGAKPTRTQGDLAQMLETLLDKGVVINADIAVTIGDTELLGVKLRAAIASFETAAEYGLEFPLGTDLEAVEAAAGAGEPAPEGGEDP